MQISDLRDDQQQKAPPSTSLLRRQVLYLKLRRCFIVIVAAVRLIRKVPATFT